MAEYTQIPQDDGIENKRALIIAVQTSRLSDDDVDVSCSELERLAATLGIEVVGRELQKRSKAAPSTFVGAGKLDELAEITAGPGQAALDRNFRKDEEEDVEEPPPAQVDMVLVDGELSPKQQHNLGLALGVEVLDRTAVILQIFEDRARTREARLEVEIARLRYELPRQRDLGAGDDRQGGGGRGERGHTNVELSKGRIRDRIAKLEVELTELQEIESTRRERRESTFQVALVGYTNAGKSSLMRALTGSEVLVENKLFATLGTTVRQLEPPTTPPILISDTVGFIKNLPHELVASFRSTLEEAKYAQFLLLVVDISDPDWRDQLRVTRETLDSIGADVVPSQIVFNKIDGIDEKGRESIAAEFPDAICLSALIPSDVERLHEALIAAQDRQLSEEALAIPYSHGELLGEVHAGGRVIDESHTEWGTALRVRARAEAFDRWRSMLPPLPAVETVDDLLEIARIHGLELVTDQDDFDTAMEGLEFRVCHGEDEDGRQWILRTPRRPEAFASSRREALALRLIRPHLPLEIPDWRLHADKVIAYPTVPGTSLWSVTEEMDLTWNIVDPTDPAPRFLKTLGQFLAALQSISIEEAKGAGIPLRSIDELRSTYRDQIEETRSVLLPDEDVVKRWHRWLDDDSLWPDYLTLVHGDLHPGHILLDDEAGVLGILDWTEAEISDPSMDLAMIYGCVGEPTLRGLLPHFEEAGGRSWPGLFEHIVERWAFHAVYVADWGIKSNDEGVLGHARQLLASISPKPQTQGV